MPKLQRWKAYAALTVGVVAIGWSAIFVRWTAMPGLASAFYRVFFATLLLWPYLLLVRKTRLHVDRRTLLLAGLGGCCFAGDIGLYNIAVLRTSAGSATFLANNSPLFVGLLTWAITRKLPTLRFWTALATALIGAASIVTIDAQHLGSRSSADMLAVIASACFALYLLFTERLRRTCDTVTLLALSTAASAIALFTICACTQHTLHILVIPSLPSLLALLGLSLVSQLTGYLCLTYALGHLPATVASVILLAGAPLTAVFALFVFAERMSALQLLGGALVLVGVWIVTGEDRTHPALPTMD
jgi:drug/metabolite transporter (DMT)-like permease